MTQKFTENIYKMKETCVRYLLDSRWPDRRETLRVNRVGHEHENSQGRSDVDCTLLINVTRENSLR